MRPPKIHSSLVMNVKEIKMNVMQEKNLKELFFKISMKPKTMQISIKNELRKTMQGMNGHLKVEIF